MSAEPDVPRLYELVSLERVDSAVQEAVRRARAGAEEGTLVWAREQTAGRGRLGRPWLSARGNLHCALVLRPEYALRESAQIVFVGAVSAGTALAELVSPMVSLHYRWPNDVLLSGAKAAGLWLAAGPLAGDRPEWVVLGLNVNVSAHPQTTEYWATSVHTLEGGPEVTAERALEEFSRQFLSWINRWAEEGFEPVRRAWLQRADPLAPELTLALGSETVRGRFVDLDARGDLVLALPHGARREVSVASFYGLR
jgi:BirA family biotin operon repressor/biotin-[acetyl-CoA-carboxylase] ligase